MVNIEVNCDEGKLREGRDGERGSKFKGMEEVEV